MLNDPIGLPCKPLVDLPLDQISYHESSHSKDFLTGWKEVENNAAVVDMDENKQDQEQDYVMQSDNESEALEASQNLHTETLYRKSGPSHKAKFKP